MNSCNYSRNQTEPPRRDSSGCGISQLVAAWFAHRAQAEAFWAVQRAAEAKGEERPELADQAGKEVREADRIIAVLMRMIPSTASEIAEMQRVPLAVLHERRRTLDTTDRLACGPILPLGENIWFGARIVAGEMRFEDAWDAMLTRQMDYEI